MGTPHDLSTRPNLTAWMDRAAANHPLAEVDLTTRSAGYSEALDALETLLAEIELAEPSVLGPKRRDFRRLTNEQQLLELRTEIAVAAKLSRAGIAFDFETESGPSPDLHLRERHLAIEVTCRTSDGLPQLLDEFEERLAGVHMAVHLRFSAIPLRMQKPEWSALIEKTIQTMAHGRGGFDPAPFEDSMNSVPILVGADIFPHGGLGPFHTKVTFDIYMQEHSEARSAIARGILGAASKPSKLRQGNVMPAVVVVDVARWGGAWNRTVTEWASDLAAMLDKNFPYHAIAVTNADIHEVDLPLGLALRPALANEDRKRVVDVIRELRGSTDLELELA